MLSDTCGIEDFSGGAYQVLMHLNGAPRFLTPRRSSHLHVRVVVLMHLMVLRAF